MDTRPHTEQLHIQKLHELCRTCGGRTLTQKEKKAKRKPKECEQFINEILLGFDVNVPNDEYTTHSSTICNLCVRKITHFRNGTATPGVIQKARNVAKSIQHIWIPFEENVRSTDCYSCSHHAFTAEGNKYRPQNTPDGTKSVLKGEFEHFVTTNIS